MTNHLAAVLFVACGVLSAVGCGSSPRAGDDDAMPCSAGTQQCVGPVLQTCVDGTFATQQTCASVCDPTLGCVECAPNKAVCLGQTSHACNADGNGYTDTACTGPGEDCDETSGGCEQPCSPASLADSYLGCEYYPTITGNEVSNTFQFAVIIANYNLSAITATLDGGPATAETFPIPAQSVVVKKLPWQTDLKLCNDDDWEHCKLPTRFSARANGGAFHIVTSKPVAVYQFNPLDYETSDMMNFSYTNDASLLFPVNVWGTAYRVASWRETGGAPGLMTIVAGQDATTVTITVAAATQGDATVASFAPNAPQSVMLDRGDVVELGTIAAGDLTGSLVTSDKPVQVIGGHFCANVPFGTGYCDHLEESMIPVRALATDYVVTSPRNDTFPDGRIEYVRIIATEPNTELTFDPPQAGVNTTLQVAGQFVELASTAANFEVTSTKKILVAQYMIGQTATTGTADPAMTVTVPTGQYRTEYLFNAPTNYTTTYLDVVAKTGTTLMLDGQPVGGTPEPVGGNGWNLIRLSLDHGPAGDGNHQISGTDQFGIQIYGYGEYTSYWFPGGLDLTTIIE